MARYDDLPVYKARYDLLLEIFRFTKESLRLVVESPLFNWRYEKICVETEGFMRKRSANIGFNLIKPLCFNWSSVVKLKVCALYQVHCKRFRRLTRRYG